jgi:hypothetical protein
MSFNLTASMHAVILVDYPTVKECYFITVSFSYTKIIEDIA